MLSNRVNGESFDRTLATISISFGAKKRSETLNDVNLWRAFGIAIYTYRYIYVYICLLIMCAYYCSLFRLMTTLQQIEHSCLYCQLINDKMFTDKYLKWIILPNIQYGKQTEEKKYQKNHELFKWSYPWFCLLIRSFTHWECWSPACLPAWLTDQ